MLSPQAYGIKFIITVDGLARKFSLKNTVLNVGNGLALLGITTVLCELVLMYFIKVLALSVIINKQSMLETSSGLLDCNIIYSLLCSTRARQCSY